MSRICKDCRYYNTGYKKTGMCTNIQAEDFGRLVWPSKKACACSELEKLNPNPVIEELLPKKMTS